MGTGKLVSPRKKVPSESEAVQQARAVGGLSERCVQMSAALRGLHPTDPRDIEQVQKEFVQAYTSAQERVLPFERQVEAFGLRFHVEATCRPGGVKKLERMVEKYRNSLQLPLDLLGAKVVVDSLWELYDMASKISELFPVVAYRDRVVFDQKGYRDLQFVVDVGGHYAEVKVIHRLVDELDVYEHRIYEVRRSLEAKIKNLVYEGGWGESPWGEAPYGDPPPTLTLIEQLVLDKLRATSADLFNDAWKMVLAAEETSPQGGTP